MLWKLHNSRLKESLKRATNLIALVIKQFIEFL